MSTYRIAHRYAGALMLLTAENKTPEAVAAELLAVKTAIEESRELRLVLESPIIRTDKKQQILAEIFTKTVSDLVRGYLLEIVAKGREKYLHDILTQYFELRDDAMGIVRVAVSTPIDFSPTQKKDLEQQLEAYTQKKVSIVFSLDSSLKGGFVARVGDTVLDGSLSRQIALLKARLHDGTMSN